MAWMRRADKASFVEIYCPSSRPMDPMVAKDNHTSAYVMCKRVMLIQIIFILSFYHRYASFGRGMLSFFQTDGPCMPKTIRHRHTQCECEWCLKKSILFSRCTNDVFPWFFITIGITAEEKKIAKTSSPALQSVDYSKIYNLCWFCVKQQEVPNVIVSFKLSKIIKNHEKCLK